MPGGGPPASAVDRPDAPRRRGSRGRRTDASGGGRIRPPRRRRVLLRWGRRPVALAVPADHVASRPRVMPSTWLPDPSHYPEPMTPLSATTWFEAVGRGLHEAMRELRGPFGGFEARTDLGW